MTATDLPASAPRAAPEAVVALAGLALPGLGYWIGGERGRAVIAGSTVLLLYLAGLLIGGVRVIDVPGYDDYGDHIQGPNGWVLTKHPITAVMSKPWSVPQSLVGPIGLVAAKASVELAERNVAPSHARVAEIGVLYTAVAGGLNLLVVIDAASRAAARREAARAAARVAAGEGGP